MTPKRGQMNIIAVASVLIIILLAAFFYFSSREKVREIKETEEKAVEVSDTAKQLIDIIEGGVFKKSLTKEN